MRKSPRVPPLYAFVNLATPALNERFISRSSTIRRRLRQGAALGWTYRTRLADPGAPPPVGPEEGCLPGCGHGEGAGTDRVRIAVVVAAVEYEYLLDGASFEHVLEGARGMAYRAFCFLLFCES
mmetsp:Transcript_11213/g.39782  ORF Transcript_11213/g.39782 Transcript_11213/m.39782 type:complete len:124 (-) Transcript_11213:52-423(-)